MIVRSATPSTASHDLMVHAYVDDELDAAHAVEFKARLDSDPGLAAAAANLSALRNTLRETLAPVTVTPHFLRRVRSSVGLEDRQQRQSWRQLAASVLIAAILSSGTTWFVLDRNLHTELHDVADAHLRSLVAAMPIDVASSERHVVKPWFNGKVSYSPKVADLSSSGFPLTGARIDVVGMNPVATLVYGRRRHVISLFVRPAEDAFALSAGQNSINGLSVVTWTADNMNYWAISDLNLQELQSFAATFRAAP